MAPERNDPAAASRCRDPRGTDTAALCAPDQSLLPEGSERELRQARADADTRFDQFRGDNARTLGGSVLGREPARWAAAFCAYARGGGDHGPPDLREAGVRACAMVPQPRKQGRAGRTARAVVSRRVRAVCGRACRGRWRAALAADSGGRGGGLSAAEIHGNLRE